MTDTFKKFVNWSRKYYRLDPCHYFSSPALSYDAMLKMTGIKLELISDSDMHYFIEKAIREAISYVAKRYGKANNKYMKNYDSSEESIFITYLDANNLYCWVMSKYLPYNRFKWLSQDKIKHFDLNLISENNLDGYILGVDLEYPHELNDLHNNYPEKPEISNDMLSKYCSDIAEKNGIKVGGVNKLVPNLGNKSKYVVHYRNLQLHLSLGMELTKIHRVLKFKQSDWMNIYINFRKCC